MCYFENNICSLFLLILFKILLLLIFDFADLAESCQSTCGGVRIQQPFGIGNGCFADKAYEVECRKTTTSTKFAPFLSAINREIVSFSFPRRDGYYEFESGPVAALSFGIVRVKNSITSTGCSSNGNEPGGAIMNLTNTPYFIDYQNSLIAVGCNGKVFLTHIKPKMMGCELNCNKSRDSHIAPFFDKTGCSRNALSYGSYNENCTEYKPEDAGCDGNKCCQVRLPTEPLQLVGIRIEDNDTTKEHCTVAFLTDELDDLWNETKPQQLFNEGYASMVSLQWVIQTNNDSFLHSLGCKSLKDFTDLETKCLCEKSNIFKSTYAKCGCNIGYEGNPYIPNGCIDINECKTGAYSCRGRDTCENFPGGYRCVRDKTKAIVIGVSAGFGVLVLIGGAWWLRKFLIKRKITKRKKKFYKRNGGLLLEQELSTKEGNVERTRIFSSRELEKATENFSENRVLGKGGQGTVYKGMLVDGRTVAVKKSKVIDEDKVHEFINEVVILSQINHRHVVKLLGCCLDTEVPILVYEFIINGSLFQYIHGEESDDYTMVWGMRLRIAMDMAGALSYLHSSASSPIYHRDIKSANVLLDEKYRAKVSDFGTSRSVTIDETHCTTVVSGTFGYMDPEYYRSSQYTEKSDVYGFGVVLAELITGEKPVIIVENTREITGLAEHFRCSMKEKRLIEIVDARIRDDYKPEQVMAVANLALKCLSSKGKKRPDMRQVYTELERIATCTEDSQEQIQFDDEEDEDEEDFIKTIKRGDSFSIGVSVTTPAASIEIASSASDVEPLFPRFTC